MSDTRQTLPLHGHLIHTLQSLGYDVPNGGVCHGYSYVGAGAILSKDLHTFNARILLIKLMVQTPFLTLVQQIEIIHQQYAQNVQNIYTQLFASAKIEWQKNELSFAEKEIVYAEARYKVNLYRNSLDEIKKLKLTIKSFLESIAACQDPHVVNKVLNINKTKDLLGDQPTDSILPFFTPFGLSSRGGMEKIVEFSGVYFIHELFNYLLGLRKIASNLFTDIPIALIISNGSHTFTLGYVECEWVYIDANYGEAIITQSELDIYNLMRAGSSSNDKTLNIFIFFTRLYILKNHAALVKNKIQDWPKHLSDTHTITSKKAVIMDRNGYSWLHIAIQNIQLNEARSLIEKGADVNLKGGDDRVPLLYAASSGSYDMVSLLIEKGAYVNGCKNNGVSPLYIAAQDGHLAIAKLLLQHKAEVNKCRNDDGASPFYIAVQKGNTDILKLLLQHGALVNKCRTDGVSPLHTAAQHGHFEVVELLIQHGAEVNKCTNKGAPPLFVAILEGHKNIVSTLLKNGADICLINNDTTALFLAVQRGDLGLVKLLLPYNPNLDYKRMNKTAEEYALQRGYHEIVELIKERRKYLENQKEEKDHKDLIRFIDILKQYIDIDSIANNNKILDVKNKKNTASPLTFLFSNQKDNLKNILQELERITQLSHWEINTTNGLQICLRGLEDSVAKELVSNLTRALVNTTMTVSMKRHQATKEMIVWIEEAKLEILQNIPSFVTKENSFMNK